MSRPKLLIAGWDGVTWDVLDPLLNAGKLPTLARLVQQGTRGVLRSVVPPISAAAWVSMMTGMNPARHGVFDFRNLNVGEYSGHDETLATSQSFSVPTLFDYAGMAQLTSIAYQVPLTYPPWPMNGVMVAGYPTPDRRRSYTYPASISEQLGLLDTHTADQVGRASPREQLAIYRRAMRNLTDNVISLSQQRAWDLLMFVNGATDGAQHRFFKFVKPGFPGVSVSEQAQYQHLLADVMMTADAELGRLLEVLPVDIHVLLISDHGGMARPFKAFNLNAWLAEQGFLRKANVKGARQQRQMVEWLKQRLPFADWAKQRLPHLLKKRIAQIRAGITQMDWLHTQAYRVKLSHPIEGVHLNVVNRQAQGIVTAEQYEPLRTRIQMALQECEEVVAVYKREEVFAGNFIDRAPDLLVHLHSDFDGGAEIDELVTDIPSSWLQSISGYHTLDGVIVAAGPAFKQGVIEGATLIDVAPTALHVLGLPVPRTMDGQVLTSLFVQHPSITYQEGVAQREEIGDGTLSEAEIAGMMSALRGLGYVE